VGLSIKTQGKESAKRRWQKSNYQKAASKKGAMEDGGKDIQRGMHPLRGAGYGKKVARPVLAPQVPEKGEKGSKRHDLGTAYSLP
jgi:hypothetical protein